MEINPVYADENSVYDQEFNVDISGFKHMVANPGHPHDDVDINMVRGTKIDSAFIGSCTNGRIEDLKIAAEILKDKNVSRCGLK